MSDFKMTYSLILKEYKLIRASPCESLILLSANNQGHGQSAHSRSLTSAFVIRSRASLIRVHFDILMVCYKMYTNLLLNPLDGVSRDEASHMIVINDYGSKHIHANNNYIILGQGKHILCCRTPTKGPTQCTTVKRAIMHNGDIY